MDSTPKPYSRVRDKIRDGDLLLYRARQKWTNRVIAQSSRSPYCHAAMAVWLGDVLMCFEMLQWRGGHGVTLSSQVLGWSGQYDVYRTNPNNLEFNVKAAVDVMVRLAGTPYGWRSLLRVGIRRLAIVRLFVNPPDDDTANGTAPHCSAAIAKACRAGGQDPVPNLADWATDPADLGRSPFFKYLWTLI